ncbi:MULTISPECIES: hypothetical protein [Sphingobacterium]|uniref:hypothetical protein n=1 Tax=Sphingobacterium TaxID=28453 RepID=UPI00257C9A25|nr:MULTISPECIES: hypothetical protein [Sphingobacterium]
MKESIIKLTTDAKGIQKCIKIDYLKVEDDDNEYAEFSSSPYDMEYFNRNEIQLKDGDYPVSMFEEVIVAAPVIRQGDPLPIITYRGMQLKKEFRKYREE